MAQLNPVITKLGSQASYVSTGLGPNQVVSALKLLGLHHKTSANYIRSASKFYHCDLYGLCFLS